MIRRAATCLSFLAGLAIAAPGRPEKPPELLGAGCETALALSAAPEHLRVGATVYVFTREGYVKTREGTNPFSCIVNQHDRARALKRGGCNPPPSRALSPTSTWWWGRRSPSSRVDHPPPGPPSPPSEVLVDGPRPAGAWTTPSGPRTRSRSKSPAVVVSPG